MTHIMIIILPLIVREIIIFWFIKTHFYHFYQGLLNIARDFCYYDGNLHTHTHTHIQAHTHTHTYVMHPLEFFSLNFKIKYIPQQLLTVQQC